MKNMLFALQVDGGGGEKVSGWEVDEGRGGGGGRGD